MSCNTRRASVVLLALTLAVSAVCMDRALAQVQRIRVKQIAPPPPPPAMPEGPGVAPGGDALNPDGFANGGITLPKDEKGRGRAIEAAVDYINDGNWPTAIERLQKLLEIDEDVFVRLKRKNAEGKEVFVWVSARQEADRLVATLPPEGLEHYKTTFAEKAAGLLKKARAAGDPSLLAEVMKRYAHTDAGGEAIKQLADYHLDRGNYIAALLCYSKLFSRQGADKLPPEVIAKAWSAARMSPASGNPATALGGSTLSAPELWKRLREHGRELKFGEHTVSLEDFESYVGTLARPTFDHNATDALVYRATPNRSNQLVGGPAFMSAEWRKGMIYDEEDPGAAEVKRAITDATAALRNQNRPLLSSFAPVTVTVKRGEERVPLLIYRDYWGVAARDLRPKKQGELYWEYGSLWGVERMLNTRTSDSQKQNAVKSWLDYYKNQYPEMLFENSTTGALSTDGQFVYAVEDFAVPPPPQMNNMVMPGMNPGANHSPEIQDGIRRSRLVALSLARSGALSWQLPDEKDDKGPLAECYFLGPPLPLAGKIYVLVEKSQEIRLVCIDPGTLDPVTHYPKPTVVSTQTLGMATDKLEIDVLRRTSVAHLSYGEGILVCPTNSGAVFGINLLENSLVWAYPYREKSDQPPMAGPGMGGMGGVRGGVVWGPGGPIMPTVPLSNQHNRWKASAPVIADGKVVFTAPDARWLHCINLRDGSPVWKKPKQEDDLYLGNVYNGTVLVVGKKGVRGLSLSGGESLWSLETGLPSGQGIGSDNVYYLPVQAGGKDKQPQIIALDLERGKVIGASQSRGKSGSNPDVPGNLLFYEGKVLSVSPTEVVAYPQLKVKIAEMDERIAKNPNDPVGLTDRGELRLDKGDLPGAVDDLTTALKNNPDAETRARARDKLYDTLTAYVADHFTDAEKYLDEYEKLCRVDLAGVPEEKRAEAEAEQRRRRATYLWLVGKGREEQGRLVEAFEKYQQFGAEARKQSELVPAVDDRQVKAAPDVWSRGRITAMLARAKPEHRAPLEKLIAQKWEAVRQTNDLNELRGFVRMFGSASEAGKEARLQLAERLMEQKDGADEHPLLEAELELNQFRTGRHSAELTARATEALARLYVRKGLLEDAAWCYRKLGGEFAKTVIREGKTGREIYDDDAATDKRLLPYLDDAPPLGAVKLKARKEAGNFLPQWPGRGSLFQFEHSGEDLPYFRRRVVGLNMQTHELKLLDRRLEDENKAPREVWHHRLEATLFQTLTQQVLLNQMNAGGATARFPYRTVGHLVILPVGHMVYGIDPVNQRELWRKNLVEGGGPIAINPGQPNGAPMWQHYSVDPRDGAVVLTYTGGWSQRLGGVSATEGQVVCVQTREALVALDPLTGRSLWTRADVPPRSQVFADEDHVFVVELDNANAPHATHVFRAADGIRVRAPDFSALFARRLATVGRNLLLSEAGPGGKVVLRLYDVLTGQDAWTQTYPARALVARGDDPALVGVLESDGKVHVVDLRRRKEVMSGEITTTDPIAQHLRNVHTVHLLADRDYFYFATQAAAAPNAGVQMVMPGQQSNVMTQLGMRTVPVNAYLYSFKRDDGEMAWYAKVDDQHLILDQFRDLPVVLLTSRRQELRQIGPGRQQWVQVVSVESFEKRSGRSLIHDDGLNGSNFFGVRIDPRARTVELVSQNLKVVHSPIPADAKKAGAAEVPATPPAQPEPPRRGAGGARPPVDRAQIREVAVPPAP